MDRITILCVQREDRAGNEQREGGEHELAERIVQHEVLGQDDALTLSLSRSHLVTQKMRVSAAHVAAHSNGFLPSQPGIAGAAERIKQRLGSRSGGILFDRGDRQNANLVILRQRECVRVCGHGQRVGEQVRVSVRHVETIRRVMM